MPCLVIKKKSWKVGWKAKPIRSSFVIYINVSSFFVIDALLADLQNSVPGQPQQPQPQYGTVQPKHQALQQQQFVDNTPGYGSLRGKAQPQVVSVYYNSLLEINIDSNISTFL